MKTLLRIYKINLYSNTDDFSLFKENLLQSIQQYYVQTKIAKDITPLTDDQRTALTQIFDTIKYPDTDDIFHVSNDVINIINEYSNAPKMNR